jgi:beta-lactamase superfamily II metal-dependent hydrolase
MYLRTKAALVLGLLLAVTATAAQAQLLRIYYPDIEQGSATLVVSPTGSALLVDAGSGLNPTDDDIVGFIRDLEDQGIITSLDYIVVTHYDEDHLGRMEDVLNFGVVASTATIYDRGTAGGVPGTFAYSDYSYAASNYTRSTITPNTTISLGGGVTVRCYVVNAEFPNSTSVDLTGTSQQENARSVGLVVQYGDFETWIGGDLTGNVDFGVADVESGASSFSGDVDIYTFNHHGSRSSSTATFLGNLKAEVGIAQMSVTNNFGHPNTEVVNRFLDTLDTDGNTPLFIQQNPGDPNDTRSDDSLASGIADPDDMDDVVGYPGTLTVLSDGTSYQFFGGAVAPLKLAADSGLGTLGNYPPAVVLVTRSPVVPLSTEGVTVSADIFDEGSFTAEIVYSVDGSAQTPVSMTQVGSTSMYQGTIPAQSDGAKVSFRVEATDSSSQMGSSAAQGYYSGTTDIDTFRVNDADGVLVPYRFAVRVEGNMTAEPGLFHEFVSQIWVQDDNGDGVQVFDRSILSINRGDRVSFVGSLEQFSGQTQINISQDFGNFGHTVISSGTVPSPQVVTVSQVGEAIEGRLIRINGVSVVSGTIAGSGGSNLTLTDDGGTSTVQLRVDDTTDIPGANTPLGEFDIIGIAGQFDSFHPYTFGYQIIPRERTDFLTDEVNHPDVLISEIHADPDATGGDANGDGSVSSTQDEFVELINTRYSPFDISGYTLSDGNGVRHTFPANTVIPAREAVVVFSGGTPTGSFGNATANGLVFTASTGALGLNNGGDTVTLKDDLGATVQAVTYGSEGGGNESLTRPDYTNAGFELHSVLDTVDGSLYSPGTGVFGVAYTVPAGAVILTEVMYDPSGSDGGLEWVEICNTTGSAIDLSRLSLGFGGGDYTNGTVQLSGTLAAGEVFVVGGLTSNANNANPTFDQAYDITPDLQNSGSVADGVALFNVTSDLIGATTVPVDAVVYGPSGSNTNNLIDETGSANGPDVGDAPSGQTIERIDLAGAWQIQSTPTPNTSTACSSTPSAGNVILTEVFYDASGSDGGKEWVELYNAGGSSVDLSGYSLGAGGGDYTNTVVQLSGTIAPGATFVVGGSTSDSSNGAPTYDQVADFSPDLQNSGSVADGVALFDVAATSVTTSTVPVDAVVYGSSNTDNLIDETGSANAPEVGDAPSGSSIERTDLAGAWQIQSTPTPNSVPFGTGGGGSTAQPILSEVFYDASSGDDGYEWVELFNPTTETIDLSGFSLGNGGSNYTSSTVQLSGSLAPGATFVVGGPTSDGTNGGPTYDQTVNFSPDFQNSGTDGDGVALFAVAASAITSSTVPIDAVVYGSNNNNSLIDETGSANGPEVGDAPGGSSIERTDLDGTWQIQSDPTPNSSPL